MPEATITIAFIDPPSKPRKPGGKLPPWRIKDTRGNIWKMWDADRKAFGIEPGESERQTFNIQYQEGEFDGKPDNIIMDVQPGDPKDVRPPPASKPSPAAQGTNSRSNPTINESKEYDRSTNTYVVELAKSNPELALAISNGDIEAGVKILRVCRLMWKKYLEPAPVKPSPVVVASEVTNEEFDDEIPY